MLLRGMDRFPEMAFAVLSIHSNLSQALGPADTDSSACIDHVSQVGLRVAVSRGSFRMQSSSVAQCHYTLQEFSFHPYQIRTMSLCSASKYKNENTEASLIVI